jgi:hypothetical protein
MERRTIENAFTILPLTAWYVCFAKQHDRPLTPEKRHGLDRLNHLKKSASQK